MQTPRNTGPDRRALLAGLAGLTTTAPLLANADTPPTPTHVVCGWCGDAWQLRADVLLAMLRVVRPKAFPVPRAWAAQVTGVNPDTLRQWIRRGHVTSYADEQVNLVDVLVRVSDTPGSAE